MKYMVHLNESLMRVEKVRNRTKPCSAYIDCSLNFFERRNRLFPTEAMSLYEVCLNQCKIFPA